MFLIAVKGTLVCARHKQLLLGFYFSLIPHCQQSTLRSSLPPFRALDQLSTVLLLTLNILRANQTECDAVEGTDIILAGKQQDYWLTVVYLVSVECLIACLKYLQEGNVLHS